MLMRAATGGAFPCAERQHLRLHAGSGSFAALKSRGSPGPRAAFAITARPWRRDDHQLGLVHDYGAQARQDGWTYASRGGIVLPCTSAAARPQEVANAETQRRASHYRP